MQQLVLDSLIYVIDHPILTLVISFIAGFLATRIAAPNHRLGLLVSFIVGLMGFFLGYFVLGYFQLNETLDSLHELRIFIDLLAAFVGSLVIAGIIHFIKPS
ncbi:MAG: GlsB/YeaQ/YmgE family stress response membrane protein [Candidatus Binatia bacterium]